jgi:hypothetical protein
MSHEISPFISSGFGTAAKTPVPPDDVPPWDWLGLLQAVPSMINTKNRENTRIPFPGDFLENLSIIILLTK